MLLDHPVNDDGRCSECGGACCRSFPNVDLSFAEYEKLRAIGAAGLLFSLNGHHKLVIEDGCEFLANGRCSIYEHRPDICRRFTCQEIP